MVTQKTIGRYRMSCRRIYAKMHKFGEEYVATF